jgi:hypothetical protein
MSFQRTSIFMNADDRKLVSGLQRRYGLSTMSETIRFALRIATVFPPKTSQRLVPAGVDKPAIQYEQVREHLTKAQRLNQQVEHRLTRAQRINQQVEYRVRFNKTLLAQRQAGTKAPSATRGTS